LPDVDEERSGHGQPAHEVVQAVADEDQIREGLPALRGSPVAVMPVQELLQDQEDRESEEQPCEERDPESCLLHRTGQHVKERASQEGPRREGHQW